ncbi:hypothetical protein EOL96_05220, partial [Candidatus Saccharibacteria bacterium]|nr:hypothetical protein [Candidatus Saccharibacteria bacterium]
KTVLKFRYVTTDNLANTHSITTNSAYSALEILTKAGYLEKVYEKSYRLLNKSARYFLSQKALVYLHDQPDIQLDEAVWKSRKSDGKKTSDFIDLQVAIHAAHNGLVARFGDKIVIDTALDLRAVEGVIKPLPGLLVTPKGGKHFFVEVADGQHLFFIRKRIRKYIENYESNEWEWDVYPDVYIIRSSASDHTRLRKFIYALMEDTYLDDTDFTFHVAASVDQIKL